MKWRDNILRADGLATERSFESAPNRSRACLLHGRGVDSLVVNDYPLCQDFSQRGLSQGLGAQGRLFMDHLNVVVALISRDNDYQAEQAATAAAAAALLGAKVTIVYAENDAVNQTQQLVKIIQDAERRPHAIVVEPVGTDMNQVARAAVAAGIGWGVLNREPEYIPELSRGHRIPVFSISVDQEEIGRIQGKQLATLATEGNVLYIEGRFSSSAAALRTTGMLSSKPSGVKVKALKGDWSEQSARHAVKSWLSLSTSRQLNVRAVMCQNDAMAMGARKAFADAVENDRDHWLNIPITGCDGGSGTGQEWVRRGLLRATVIAPPIAGTAIDILVRAMRTGSLPRARTQVAPESFPPLAELAMKNRAKQPAAGERHPAGALPTLATGR